MDKLNLHNSQYDNIPRNSEYDNIPRSSASGKQEKVQELTEKIANRNFSEEYCNIPQEIKDYCNLPKISEKNKAKAVAKENYRNLPTAITPVVSDYANIPTIASAAESSKNEILYDNIPSISSKPVVQPESRSQKIEGLKRIEGKAAEFFSQGKFSEAFNCHQEAMSIKKSIFGENHSEVAVSLYNLGICSYHQNKNAEALAWHKESLKMRQQVFGNLDASVAKSWNQIGLIHMALNQPDEAFKSFMNVLEILHDSNERAIAMNNIGMILSAQGEYEKALKITQQALKLLEADSTAALSDRVSAWNNIGTCQRGLKDKKASVKSFECAVQVLNKINEANPLSSITVHHNLASAYLSVKEFSQALKYTQITLELRAKAFKDDHILVAHSWDEKGVCYQKKPKDKNYYNTLECFEIARQIFENLKKQDERSLAAIKAENKILCLLLDNPVVCEKAIKWAEEAKQLFGEKDERSKLYADTLKKIPKKK